MTTILVTGATGTIGSQLIKQLTGQAGIEVRAAVREASEAASLRQGNVTPVSFDYEKPASIAAAVAGVDRVFLLTPFAPNRVELGQRLVDAAKAAGVKHIVKLSAIGAQIEPGIQLGRWHRAIERAIEASGVPWTFLRPNNFMENFVGYYPPDKEVTIYLPWGDAACSFITGGDVAAVAAAALTGEGHAGKAYELTGPEAFTIAQAAAIIGEVSGRQVRYVDVPEEAARQAMLGMQMPSWMTEAMLELHAIDKAGYAAAVSPTFQEITGRAPRSFRDFAREHAARWKA